MRAFTIIALLLLTLYVKNETADIPEKVFEDIQPHIKLNSTLEFDDLLSKTDSTYFLYYYKKSSKNSRIGASILVEVAKKLVFLVQIILVDCDSDYGLVAGPCIKNLSNDTNVDNFPRMYVERPPDVKINPYTGDYNKFSELMYQQQEVSYNSIHKFITDNIPSGRITVLSQDNIEGFLK